MPTTKNPKDADSVRPADSDPIESLNESQAQNQSTEPVTVDDQSIAELANHVLHGRFGNFNDARENLDRAGADSTAVLAMVNQRLSRGAPSSYRPNISQVLDSARRGEWGDKNIALRVRGAGFSEADALHVEASLNQES